MAHAPFSRYLLRTTDVAAATAFYDAVLEGRGDGILPLHESAIARGARPHWLGHISVAQIGGTEAAAARFIERGATRLGPPPGVGDFVILRDPVGAIVALTDRTTDSSAGVVWHQLNTREPLRAAEIYSALLGWSFGATQDLGKLGRLQRFAFAPGDPAAGMFLDTEGRTEVHTHWLFFFSVRSLDGAVDRARELGGLVVGPIALPNGIRVAVCDDPQGAAFGIIQTDDAARLANE